MKFKLLALTSLTSVALLSSCEWTGRQLGGMEDWANRNMPTYDGSRPGLKNQAQEPLISPNYNGYPYTNGNRTPLTGPGVSGANMPTPPSLAPRANGLTPAQAASATEGGNSRPGQMAAPVPPQPMAKPQTNFAPPPPPAAPVPAAPRASMVPPPPPPAPIGTNGRRAPAGQLPPSAIQPVPYGAQQPAPKDDFPAEYQNPVPNREYESMIPPPPM